jgi:hypothetical protein
MPQSLISVFVDDAAVAARTAEVPDAEWNSGMFGGSCQPGIGISTENPDLQESLPNWTLLDQFGDARVGQIGQNIGGTGYSDPSTSSGDEGTLPGSTIRLVDATALDGSGTLGFPAPNAELVTLEAGWTPQP